MMASSRQDTMKQAHEQQHGHHQGQQQSIPSFFFTHPPIRDDLRTDSSEKQDATVDECLPFLDGIPRLDRLRHARFLHNQLGNLPAAYTAADPSRPWFFYWCLAALSLLGEEPNPSTPDEDPSDPNEDPNDPRAYRSRLVRTVRPMQNSEGGFGGGFGQTSHLATTYATVLSLAIVGGSEAYDVVDRRAMWRWLSMLKQPDGGFQMAVGGEEDVRGAYCAAVVISLLDLPLELAPESPARAAGHTTLFSGLAEWIGSCQTYEGGVSAKPGVEAHGAYAFCALGCLSIVDTPYRSVNQYLDVPRLLSWLSSRQYAPEGGLSGRTNKLVDGCYSHWVGGCWPLIEASLGGPEKVHSHSQPEARDRAEPTAGPTEATPDDDDDDDDGRDNDNEDDTLFSRNGLIRYILCCCQDMSKRGGMRDKPSKYSDAYHSCYVLSGLSSAQHKWRLVSARAEPALLRGDRWAAAPFAKGRQIFDEEDRVATTHPVYVIPPGKVDAMWQYFADKQGF